MIEIRALRKNDNLTNLIPISREFFREYERHHKDFFMIDELKDEAVISYFTSFCETGSRKAFIAVDGQQIVGYITVYIKEQADYWRYKKIGEISGLMVQREFQHQGIAKRLVDAAKAFFTAEGVKYYTVYTAVANQGALDFYRKNGLVPLYTTMIGET